MTFEEWVQMGIDQGYCSEVVCATHDGLPYGADEEEAFDDGYDPCVPAVRLLSDGRA